MPQLDGSIRIGTEITTKEAQKELKNLESNITKTADKIASLRSKMDALKDVKIPTSEYKKTQNELESTIAKYTELDNRINDFKKIGMDIRTDAFRKTQDEAQELYMKIEDIRGAMFDLEESGKAFTFGSDTEKYAQMAAQMQQLNQQMQADTQRQSELQSALVAEEQRLVDIKANAAESDQQMISLLERRKQLTKEIADMEKAGLGYGYQEYDSAQQELSAVNSQISEYKDNLATVPERFSQMNKSAQKAFSALSSGISKSSGLFSMLKNSASRTFQTMSKGAKQSTGLISTFASRLKGLAASAFIFNLISKGFNSMVSSMKTGFTNLMEYSGSFANSIQSVKNSLSTLGNQIAVAFAPIVQAVIPWLNQLISALSTAMTYVAQFIAALTGKSTFTKAKKVQDGYNKSLDNTAAAAKKAYGALAKFDDLDVLQKKEEDETGAGGGAGGGMGDLFEEVPIESSILDAVEKLKDILAQLFAPLKEAWEREGQFVMDSWKYALSEIWQLMKDMGRDFLTMWNQEATVKMFADVLHIAGDIGLVVGNIAHALDEAWNKNQTGLHILENIRDIFAVIIRNIREVADFTVEWSKTLDFSPLLESIEHLTRSLIPFADFVSGTLADFYTQFILPLTSWTLSENGLPRLINIFGDFMDAVDWEALRESLKNLYAALEPYAESIAEGLIDFLEKIKDIGIDILNSLPGPIQKLADALNSGDPEKIRSWTTTTLEFVAAIVALKTAFAGFEAVSKGLTLLGFGGAAGSVTAAGTAMEGAAVGGGLLTTALNGIKSAAGYAATTLAAFGATSLIVDNSLEQMGEAAGANKQQIATLSDRYDGLGGKLNVVKDAFSLVGNAMDGFGFNASNTAGQIGALETVMNNIADGTIYTDSQLEKLQKRFGLTDEDMEMLRQSMLDTNEPLRQLADDFGLFDASVETLQNVQEGMKLVEDGTITAGEAFNEFSKPMWGMNDASLTFFETLSNSGLTINEYKQSLSGASEATQQFSDDINKAGENISDGITKGFENADVETPVRGFFASIVDSLRSIFNMHSPAKNMEPFGENILLGVLEGFKNTFGKVGDTIAKLLKNIQKFFSDTWSNIQKNTSEVWAKIQEWLTKTMQDIQKFFTDIWNDIQNWFTGFWNRFTKALQDVWENIVSFLKRKLEEIRTFFRQKMEEIYNFFKQKMESISTFFHTKIEEIKNFFNNFISFVSNIISTSWSSAWDAAANVFGNFKSKIESIVDGIKNVLGSFVSWVSDIVSKITSAIGSIGDSVSSANSSIGQLSTTNVSGRSAYSAEMVSALNDVPQLASGAVLRGGNPFMAILNEQPRGQTNIEAPLKTIEQAVENVMNRKGYNDMSSGVLNQTISLNVNGQEFARLTLGDILNEMSRQGYDVSVLGVT